MSKKFWAHYSIKQQPVVKEKPAVLINKLRGGRVDVSQMSQPELAGHMSNEAMLLRNIRDASGLPAVRPLQSEYDNIQPVNLPSVSDQLITPPDATSVRRKKP